MASLPLAALLAAATAKAAPVLDIDATPSAIDPATGTGTLAVEMSIPAVDLPVGGKIAELGLGMPGQARMHRVSDLGATDSAGAIPLQQKPGMRSEWLAGRAVSGPVKLRYTLHLENIAMLQGGPPTAVRIDGRAFSGIGSVLFAEPALAGAVEIRVRWHLQHMPRGAEAVTSFGDGDITLPAGPADRLGRAVYMVGPVWREPAKGDIGGFSSVWADDPGFDPRPVMRWTATLHGWMSRFFGDETAPPYRVFMRYNPMNAGGGAALYNSFLITYGKGVTGGSLRNILGHEMTHTWTANGLGKWYDEGNAVYYQALLPWRAGLLSADEYLADVNETASRYYTNLLRTTPEEEAVRRFWEDTRVRVLPYDRGAMYFAALNGMIRRASGGQRSVDDLVLALVRRARDNEPITEALWLDMLRGAAGEPAVALHKAMLAGELVIPRSDDFGPCFRRTTKMIRRFDVGFDFASLIGSDKVVRGLKPGSEAEKAGVREGDRISYGIALDALQGDASRPFTVEVTRSGRSFPITYLPRGEAVEAYQWERDPAVPETMCHSW
ncbi:hypothetical protein [Sphingopyxis sp.]|uniref:hypothetical protein n=1 Tax=Sphingopyxis sp. TaxID=1908224 RepID=UPI002EDB79C9